MTIRLRPHHFLCMLTFAGKGYSSAFVTNFEKIIGRISAGAEEIEVVEGPDDICTTLMAESDCHCRNASVMLRDHHAAEALSDLLQRPIQPGTQLLLSHDHLRLMREEFAEGTIRESCAGCQWASTCDAIAQNNFKETRLLRMQCHEDAIGLSRENVGTNESVGICKASQFFNSKRRYDEL